MSSSEDTSPRRAIRNPLNVPGVKILATDLRAMIDSVFLKDTPQREALETFLTEQGTEFIVLLDLASWNDALAKQEDIKKRVAAMRTVIDEHIMKGSGREENTVTH